MEKKTKKQTVFILVMVLIFVTALILGVYLFIDSIIPMAKTIGFPVLEEVESIHIFRSGHSMSISITQQQYVDLNEYIREAEPTRIQAMNDYPTVRPYYGISVKAKLRTFTYFVYEDNGRVYIEMPYEGIYEVNDEILDLMKSYFQ